MIKTVGIIGIGLIGGSIAKALKNKFEMKIYASNRSLNPLKIAYSDGIIDKYCDFNSDMNIFSDCDIIFICTPVDRIKTYIDKIIPYIKKNCIITDVGSTKNNIYSQMLEYSKNNDVYFIGGHPMTGSEQTGYLASNETLFENAFYVLTPIPNVPDEKIKEFSKILKKIGAIPIIIPSDIHDKSVAAISHVPHIIAASLVNMVCSEDGDEHYMHTLAAGGFKDITRIASSSPEVWSSICMENKEEILNILNRFKNTISKFEENLYKNNTQYIYDFFESSKKYRDTFAEKKTSSIPRVYDIFVDVCDKPGIIATISTLLSVNNINIKNIGIINNREYQSGALQIVFNTEKEKEQSVNILKDMNFTIYTSN